MNIGIGYNSGWLTHRRWSGVPGIPRRREIQKLLQEFLARRKYRLAFAGAGRKKGVFSLSSLEALSQKGRKIFIFYD